MALLPANHRRVGKENWLSINLYFILFCSIRGVMSNLLTGKPLNLIKSLIFAQNINKLYLKLAQNFVRKAGGEVHKHKMK